MKTILIIIISVLLAPGLSFGATTCIHVPNKGATGWQTYTYTAGPGGFTGMAGFVVSNVKDNSAYSVPLDNLSHGGGASFDLRGDEPDSRYPIPYVRRKNFS